jgi:ubiquilin
MADNADAGEVTLSFKVKTSGDKTHAITMPDSATVLDLKNKLAQPDFENISVDRQRLIYSGRVMKNDDTLKVYKIKPGNTIHMVKSAASNPAAAPSNAAAPAPAAVPQNMAAGVPANNLLAGLTGARFAGHGINLPGAATFGADGGVSTMPPIHPCRHTLLFRHSANCRLTRWAHRQVRIR